MRLKEKYLVLVECLEFEKALGNLPIDANPRVSDQFEAMVRTVERNTRHTDAS